jgi:conjugal transfer pilus assembly protein TraV
MITIQTIYRYGTSVLLIILTTGCATTEYGCKGMPDEPSCLSTTQAYQITNPAMTDATLEQPLKSDSISKPSQIAPLQQSVPKIEDPTPIRSPSQVMRIWIAPWEDADGDLMVSNYVYTELEPRRWMIGKTVPTAHVSLVPLQVEQRIPDKHMSLDVNDEDNSLTRSDYKLP